MSFKVGDFVYFETLLNEREAFPEEFCGYGTIIEIKDYSKYYLGDERKECRAIIDINYFVDGLPCDSIYKKAVRLDNLEDPKLAIKRRIADLDNEKERLMKIYKKEVSDL